MFFKSIISLRRGYEYLFGDDHVATLMVILTMMTKMAMTECCVGNDDIGDDVCDAHGDDGDEVGDVGVDGVDELLIWKIG